MAYSVLGWRPHPTPPSPATGDFSAGDVWNGTLVAEEVAYADTVLHLNALRVRTSPASFLRDRSVR